MIMQTPARSIMQLPSLHVLHRVVQHTGNLMWCGNAEARYYWLAVGELEGLKAAVSLVKETAQELLAATNPADAPMLTLSLREVTSMPCLFTPHKTQLTLH